MFPFFSTNWPCRVTRTKRNKESVLASLPRIVMDGYFTVPFGFGCPDLEKALRDTPSRTEHVLTADIAKNKQKAIDRTVTVSVILHDLIFLSTSSEHDRISPAFDKENPVGQVEKLLRLATSPLTKTEVYSLYEEGWADAEHWAAKEDRRASMKDDLLRNEARTEELGQGNEVEA